MMVQMVKTEQMDKIYHTDKRRRGSIPSQLKWRWCADQDGADGEGPQGPQGPNQELTVQPHIITTINRTSFFKLC